VGDDRADAGDGHQPLGDGIVLGALGDLHVQDGDLRLQKLQRLREGLQNRPRLLRQIGRRIHDQVDQLGRVLRALADHLPNSAR
jgi:hypothetical protein